MQVQPERSKGLDLDRLMAACTAIAADTNLVDHPQFDRGHDQGLYLNFTFGTHHAAALWRLLRTRSYEDEELGAHLCAASMAVCSSTEGWDDYLLLYHFDPVVTLDPDTTL